MQDPKDFTSNNKGKEIHIGRRLFGYMEETYEDKDTLPHLTMGLDGS